MAGCESSRAPRYLDAALEGAQVLRKGHADASATQQPPENNEVRATLGTQSDVRASNMDASIFLQKEDRYVVLLTLFT